MTIYLTFYHVRLSLTLFSGGGHIFVCIFHLQNSMSEAHCRPAPGFVNSLFIERLTWNLKCMSHIRHIFNIWPYIWPMTLWPWLWPCQWPCKTLKFKANFTLNCFSLSLLPVPFNGCFWQHSVSIVPCLFSVCPCFICKKVWAKLTVALHLVFLQPMQ